MPQRNSNAKKTFNSSLFSADQIYYVLDFVLHVSYQNSIRFIKCRTGLRCVHVVFNSIRWDSEFAGKGKVTRKFTFHWVCHLTTNLIGWLDCPWMDNFRKEEFCVCFVEWKVNLPIRFGRCVVGDRFVIRFVDLKLLPFNLHRKKTMKKKRKIYRIKLESICKAFLLVSVVFILDFICVGYKLHFTI